ncbi:MAG: discoidin domain-containing protein [Bacteroidales bacterium]|nr:discoidin domain-containing protein [Bacteroidales bacterium]
MKKSLFFIFNLLIFTIYALGCDTTKINREGWQILYVDSEELTGEGEDNGHAFHCLDGDSTTFWHTQWQNTVYQYPHEIWIDLGETHNINGFSVLTRGNNTRNGRINQFEFYVTSDTTDWGAPQSAGILVYPQPNSGVQQTAEVFFGAVEGRYVRLVGLNSVAGDNYTMIAELNVYEDTACAPTGMQNQVIYATPVERQYATNPPFVVHAHTSSGLPLAYEIADGPATIADSTVTLTGAGGIVTIRLSQPGDSVYYPIETTLSFEVVNLNDYYPEIRPRLTADYPVEMPQLMPYLLHTTASIAESDSLSVDAVIYSIGGEELTGLREGNDFVCWWTPSEYGTVPVTITATASNGNTTAETIMVEVTNNIMDRMVTTLDSAIIDNGNLGIRTYTGRYTLPQFTAAYNTIVAYLTVTCPSLPGGCDDWDRLAYVQVKDPSTGKWVEIIRYITPYGKACSHHIDVTDFASLLQGDVDIRMFIDTWGTGGWQIQLDFEYLAGEPEYTYTYVEEMWQGSYNFGDPANLQPLDTVTVGIFGDARKAHVRLTTTGHGWGDNNTGNAAEFYHAVHHLQVNGEDTFEQDLWTDCYPNPDGCNNQNGTYKYDRAGWCPGSISQPYIYDVTNYLWQTPFQMSYIFQPSYMDQCHPHNPDCVTGVTCADCNAGSNPFYRVSCYLIRSSNETRPLGTADRPNHKPVEDAYSFMTYPNPCAGSFRITFFSEINERFVCTLVNASGERIRTYFFNSSHEAEQYLFDVSSVGKGIYFLEIYTKNRAGAQKIVIQ